jgi:hypothetical protein
VDALTAGWDAEPLAILAGLEKPPNEFEVDRYRRDALDELGIRCPAPGELPHLLALLLADDIVGGAVSPVVGCRELDRLYCATGYPELLMPFLLHEDQLELAERGVFGTIAEVRTRILEAARGLLDRTPLRACRTAPPPRLH